MTELLRDNLPVGLRKSADGERYEIGVSIDGAFVPVGGYAVSQLEADLAEAARQQAEAAEPQNQSQA